MTSPKELALVFLVLAPLCVLFAAVPPIAQDAAYHVLADTRSWLGIPSFANVASNVAFLIVGFLGLKLCAGRGVSGAGRSWTVFFFGVVLVALGSAYYHWAPANETLAWDRLPMTIAFTALFSALVAEHVRPEIERALLRGALLTGIAAVGWWHYTGDLRLYAWVQFAPLLALGFIAVAFSARYSHRGWLLVGLALYALAKVAEHMDASIFAATSGFVSGHTLKHLIAALAPLCVYIMLRDRRLVAPT